MNPYTKLPDVPILQGRQPIVLDYCRNKRVLHLGCVDAGLVEERFAKNELMHQKLAQVAEDLWGLDIDAKGIEFLRTHGFDQLIVADASVLEELDPVQGVPFDVIVASEVVEHLQNPGLFFQNVRTLMTPNHTQFIVTVPNAFRIDTLLRLLRGDEYVHPDHNYWFSYRTITNLFTKNGFTVDEVFVYTFQSKLVMPNRLKRLFAQRSSVTSASSAAARSAVDPATASGSAWARAYGYVRSLPRRALVSWLYKKSPFWADGLIVVGRVVENTHESV